jgi:hypothetical protein
LDRYSAGVREPVLDRPVNVAQLWRLALDAARKGEKGSVALAVVGHVRQA